MRRSMHDILPEEVIKAVRDSVSDNRIVNVSKIAERIRLQYEHENIALEDIEALVMQVSQSYMAAMEFDRSLASGGGVLEVMVMNDAAAPGEPGI